MNVHDPAPPHNGGATERGNGNGPQHGNHPAGYDRAEPPNAPPWAGPLPFAPPFDPPRFPDEVLPGCMRAFALALAEEKQVPLDLPALLMLGAMAAAIARKVVVSSWPGWSFEPTNLFLL